MFFCKVVFVDSLLTQVSKSRSKFDIVSANNDEGARFIWQARSFDCLSILDRSKSIITSLRFYSILLLMLISSINLNHLTIFVLLVCFSRQCQILILLFLPMICISLPRPTVITFLDLARLSTKKF